MKRRNKKKTQGNLKESLKTNEKQPTDTEDNAS